MRVLTILLFSLFVLSCSHSVLSQSAKSTIHVGEYYDNEGYVFFHMAMDSLTVEDLTKDFMSMESTDTCYVNVYLSIYKDLTVTKDSINFECNNDSMLETLSLNNFLANFTLSIREPYNIPFEPFEFYMPISILIGPHDKSARKRFRFGYNMW